MRKKWYSKLQRPSSKVTNLPGFIDSLPRDYQEILDKLMQALSDNFPDIQVLPVGGYSLYGFHVKYRTVPNASGYDVCMMIIPYKTKGIRVKVRKSLGKGWVRKLDDGQILWRKMINGDSDIAAIVKYCHDECCGRTL